MNPRRIGLSLSGSSALAVLLASCGGSGSGSAAPGPVALQQVVAGLSSPVCVTNAHDGFDRLFILEQRGVIKVLLPHVVSTADYLDISSRVVSGGEQGLLGLAFHPQFRTNGRFFVDYTRRADGATVIAEYHQSATNPAVADPTETILLVIPQPFPNHNGGMLAFGPDGDLYIGMGDGGSGNDPGNRAQNPQELLGKILRIDVDHPANGLPYGMPPDNPFASGESGRPEIYALGLRNPWRFSFDRATGQLIAGDVGQDSKEEVDIITRGANYGWRVYEGFDCTNNDPSLCGHAGYTPPVIDYGHTGGRCAVTGGYAYRGSQSTLPAGLYVFGDYCTGEVFSLLNGAMSPLLSPGFNLSSFGEDESGEIYAVSLGGTVYKIVRATAGAG